MELGRKNEYISNKSFLEKKLLTLNKRKTNKSKSKKRNDGRTSKANPVKRKTKTTLKNRFS